MNEDVRHFLEDAAGRRESNLVEVSIRELISKWGFQRRRIWTVSQIERDLEEMGLTTDPPFAQEYLDSAIKLIPYRLIPPKPESAEETKPDQLKNRVDVTEVALTVGSLRSAGRGVCSITPQATLLEAQSIMVVNDYSQLAVMGGPRSLKGAITWESIAQASLKAPRPGIAECTIPAEVVRRDDDLISQIPRIVRAGYVFVQGHDASITGIVTTADLSEEFGRLGTPFFLIGEIERRLRRAVDRVFSSTELRGIRDPKDNGRDVASAEDLTFGEYEWLFSDPGRWDRMKWRAERTVFMKVLAQVRILRNEIMHFSPDPLEESDVEQMRGFIRFLRFLEP